MATTKEGFQSIDAASYIYPSWHSRFHDIFSAYEPVFSKLNTLSKVYDATTIYKSRYFGYSADSALSRYWVAAQDKQYPLTTVLASGEPTVTTDVFTMDKVYGFMANQLFVEGYRATDLDPSVRNLSAWSNFVPVNLTQMSRPFLQSAGGSLPTLELDEAIPFVRLRASSQNAFTFTNVAASPVHTVQFRIPTLNSGIPTPILEYALPTAASSTTSMYVRVNAGGNLQFVWGYDGIYTSPYLIAGGTWYSLYIAIEPAKITFSVSPFDNPTPFDKQDVFELTGMTANIPTANATIGRNGTTYTSIDVYQALAYMGIYKSG
jgi:hypothetical protein